MSEPPERISLDEAARQAMAELLSGDVVSLSICGFALGLTLLGLCGATLLVSSGETDAAAVAVAVGSAVILLLYLWVLRNLQVGSAAARRLEQLYGHGPADACDGSVSRAWRLPASRGLLLAVRKSTVERCLYPVILVSWLIYPLMLDGYVDSASQALSVIVTTLILGAAVFAAIRCPTTPGLKPGSCGREGGT